MNSLYGKKPKTPVQEVAQPIEKIQQSNIADETVRKQWIKRKKATVLNQVTEPANLKRKKLGAG